MKKIQILPRHKYYKNTINGNENNCMYIQSIYGHDVKKSTFDQSLIEDIKENQSHDKNSKFISCNVHEYNVDVDELNGYDEEKISKKTSVKMIKMKNALNKKKNESYLKEEREYDSESGSCMGTRKTMYVVVIAGTFTTGEDVVCHVIGWKPYFYVKTKNNKKPELNVKGLIITNEEWVNGGEYTAGEKTLFYKIEAESINSIQYAISLVNKDPKMKIFDNAFEMPIKFLHDIGIGGHDIIAIKNFKNIDSESRLTFSSYEIICNWKSIIDPLKSTKPDVGIDNKISQLINLETQKNIMNCTQLPNTNNDKKSNVTNNDKISNVMDNNKNTYNTNIQDRDIIVAFDIETSAINYSSDTGFIQYPSSYRDPVISIGISAIWSDETIPFERYVLILGQTNDNGKNELLVDNMANPNAPPIKFICFNPDEESDLLLKFAEILRKLRPGYILTYNGNGYDWIYLEERSYILGVNVEFSQLSRFKYKMCIFKNFEISSSAIGKNKSKFYNIPCCCDIDVMNYIQRDPEKLQEYSLKAVLKFAGIKVSKIDLPYTDMFKMYQKWYQKYKLSNKSKHHKNENENENEKRKHKHHHKKENENGEHKHKHHHKKKNENDDNENDDNEIDNNETGKYNANPVINIQKDGNVDTIKIDTPKNIENDGAVQEVDDIAKIGYYNMRDCDVLHELNKVRMIISTGTQFANLCMYPMYKTYYGGSSIRCISMLIDGYKKLGMLFDPRHNAGNRKKLAEKLWSKYIIGYSNQKIVKKYNKKNNTSFLSIKDIKKNVSGWKEYVFNRYLLLNLVREKYDTKVQKAVNVFNKDYSKDTGSLQTFTEKSIMNQLLNKQNEYDEVMDIKRSFDKEKTLDDIEFDNSSNRRSYNKNRLLFIEKLIKFRKETIEDLIHMVKFEGARVFDAVSGLHKRMIVGDVASMYPSLIIFYNLSHNTLVKNKKYLKGLKKDIDYTEFEYKLRYGKVIKCIFVHKNIEESVLSGTLIKINTKRKQVREDMDKLNKNDPKWHAKNSLQNAYKIIANTVYGLIGSELTKMSEQDIAGVITKMGREFISFAAIRATELVDLEMAKLRKEGNINNNVIKLNDNKLNDKYDVIELDDERISEIQTEKIKRNKKKKYAGLVDMNIVADPKIHRIKYGDTDSIFIKIDDDVFKSEKECLDYIMQKGGFGDRLFGIINKEYNESKFGAVKGALRMVLEKMSEILLLSKKRYSTLIHIVKPDGKIDYEGVRKDAGNVLKRRDTVLVTKYVYSTIINNLISGKLYGNVHFIKHTLKEIARGEFALKCYVKSQSYKGKDAYDEKRKLAHVEIAKRLTKKYPQYAPQSNARIEYIFKFCGIKGKACPSKTQYSACEMAHHICELKKNDELDYGYYIRKCVGEPLTEIMVNIFHWTYKECEELFYDYSYYYGPNAIEKDKHYKSTNKHKKDIDEKKLNIFKNVEPEVIEEYNESDL